ncbi:MAG: hypothetical protein K5851_03305 [Lachnospiraceae bacterium]|nr:hypothetical protein [Lachnospiraceae bacterium]
MSKKGMNRKILFLFIAFIINLLIAFGIIILTDYAKNVVIGSDTMYHIYRGQWLLDEIRKDNWYPLFNPVWYNGVELMRYWTPAAAYLMALCHLIAGFFNSLPYEIFQLNGQVEFGGFCVYAGFIYLIGSMNWCIVGLKHNRKWLGFFLGFLYFFCPTGIYLFFAEGNLPRSLIIAIFPLFVDSVACFFESGKRRNLLGISITFFLIVMSHVGYAGMVAIAFLIYVLVNIVITYVMKREELISVLSKSLTVIVAILIGFMMAGIFLVPALKGGLAQNSGNTSQVAMLFFQPIFKTLNPIGKYHAGYSYNYFGLAFFLMALLGLFGSKYKGKSEFLTAIIIFFMTSSMFAEVLISLPGGQFLWMTRFLPMLTAIIFFGVMKWKTLKKGLLVFMCVLMLFDSVQVCRVFEPQIPEDTPNEYYEEEAKAELLDKAKEITVNRVALLNSTNASYYLTGIDKPVLQCFGQGWEAATTKKLIVELNEAYDTAEYNYLFDRMIELGCDTVVLDKTIPVHKKYNETKVKKAATANGYELVDDNKKMALFHLKDAKTTFGVITKYDGLAIGEGSLYISRMFPDIEYREDKYLDDYDFDTLKQYSKIYLFKFKYHNIEGAENLITKLASSGTDIYVMADGMPINPHTQTEKFLGVETQKIEFENAFPMIHSKKYGDFVTKLFTKDLKKWHTVYLNGLDETDAYIKVLDKPLSVVGTKLDGKVHFIGMNLTYFYATTRDENVARLLSGIIGISETQLPKREIVPIDIKYNNRSIEINSPRDDVDTTIAMHDIFGGQITSNNNLVYVDSGKTVITMHYPYFKSGLILSIFGFISMILLVVEPFHRKKVKRIDSKKIY